jgi:hypothetical protein
MAPAIIIFHQQMMMSLRAEVGMLLDGLKMAIIAGRCFFSDWA